MFSLAALLFPCLLVTIACIDVVLAFSNDRSDNLAVYWGQDAAGHQQRLSFYCEDDTIDAIPMAFLYIFHGKGGQPVLELSNICNHGTSKSFPGTDLLDCSFLAADIRQCQAKGKIVTLSLGGATSSVGFSSESQATEFATTIWNMFLGGKSSMRPFGSAVLDGIDLDIESGSASFYGAFVNKIRSLAKGAKKRYYVTAAPQCPFPDAKLGAALNSAFFDAVYVQFYNNYCETSVPSEFNFDTWDNWAKTKSPNRDIKVYLGGPGSAKAAGNGYVDANTLAKVAKDAQQRYSSFGGVMLWDADVAYTNNRYDRAIKTALTGGSPRPRPQGPSPNPDPRPDDPPTPTQKSPSTPAIIEDPIESDKDPRATARVKRPTFGSRAEASGIVDDNQAGIKKPLRFFRF
ncbi:chitinase [Collybia nuda]|uniref:chitinase n=1 Tax=Collybia nuda TaxID=64659 RepID=A0A9P5Y1C5_9AGAR|nr:chitinase [Collybia nuda]